MELLLYDFFNTLFFEYTYPFVFFLIFALSVIPVLTPPTWIVVVSAYSLDEQLNPFLLSVVGASAAIAGRLLLLQLSSFGRKDYKRSKKT